MTVRYLVDTDWVIHYVNGHSRIVARLDALTRDGLGVSVVSLAELYEGVYYSTNPEGNERGLNEFLRAVAVIGIDTKSADASAGSAAGSVPRGGVSPISIS